jgi:tripartite-type tricarboxylate transporter receptor subunit TctC
VLLPHVQSGKLRALAGASPRRAALLPDLPTMAEEGLPGVEAVNWYGVLVPAKTPLAVLLKLNDALVQTLLDPGVRAKMAARGADAVGNRPEEFESYLRQDIERWAKLAHTVRIKVD